MEEGNSSFRRVWEEEMQAVVEEIRKDFNRLPVANLEFVASTRRQRLRNKYHHLVWEYREKLSEWIAP